MKNFMSNVRKSLLAIAVVADLLCLWSAAHAAGPAAPPPDDPVSLSITPRYRYQSPSIMGASPEASDLNTASGVDEPARPTPALEKPDNWACRTSNNLTRSSIGKNPDGRSISDIQGLLPKC
ncbi:MULTISPECIES: hypothetical protein [Burkholderiaceae]|jgi:hypothetical protein|uniref:hypothetical protein n=1 Tax=Burkholderiaceae TaxID=119060 RepID=UPI000AFE876C|nr:MULTISPECIES: hypothetical protein [Burkholderiaceae]